MQKIDRTVFFDTVRSTIFGDSISASQVSGCISILEAWNRSGHSDLRWLAYMLATTFHEVAGTMQPIKEFGGSDYFHRMYDIEGDRPHVARTLGNLYPGDGVRFAGRGYVQLTGRDNYVRASEIVGADLTVAPDLAMRPDIAAAILVDGMVDGWFTGRRLAHYFSDTAEDWTGARRIVNGLDRAELIAGYAKTFHEALLESTPGKSAPSVQALQRALNDQIGEPFLIVDGILGKRTAAAIRNFQSRNGLDVDGVAGPKTLEALGLAPGSRRLSDPSTLLSSLGRLLKAALTWLRSLFR